MLLKNLRGDLEVQGTKPFHFTTKTQKLSLSRSLRGLKKPVEKYLFLSCAIIYLDNLT